MHRIIFYSWQPDLPNSTNRALIQRALESAAKVIAKILRLMLNRLWIVTLRALQTLRERHEGDSALAQLIPFHQFLAADYFLFLRGELSSASGSVFPDWIPWSSVYLKSLPHFIRDAERVVVAEKLAKALGVNDLPSLKEKLHKIRGRLKQLWQRSFWSDPLGAGDIDRIGTT